MKTPVLDAMYREFGLQLMTVKNLGYSDIGWSAHLVDEETRITVTCAYAKTRKEAIKNLEADVAVRIATVAECLPGGTCSGT